MSLWSANKLNSGGGAKREQRLTVLQLRTAVRALRSLDFVLVAHFRSFCGWPYACASTVCQCYDCADLKAVNCKVPSHHEFQLWKCVSSQCDRHGNGMSQPAAAADSHSHWHFDRIATDADAHPFRLSM